jgi:hypothetical protein
MNIKIIIVSNDSLSYKIMLSAYELLLLVTFGLMMVNYKIWLLNNASYYRKRTLGTRTLHQNYAGNVKNEGNSLKGFY